MAETATIGPAELEGLIAAALIASRTAEANARSVARALAQAEIDGQKGHGLSRVPRSHGVSAFDFNDVRLLFVSAVAVHQQDSSLRR